MNSDRKIFCISIIYHLGKAFFLCLNSEQILSIKDITHNYSIIAGNSNFSFWIFKFTIVICLGHDSLISNEFIISLIVILIILIKFTVYFRIWLTFTFIVLLLHIFIIQHTNLFKIFETVFFIFFFIICLYI